MIENHLIFDVKGTAAEQFYNSDTCAELKKAFCRDYGLSPDDVEVRYEPVLK